MSRWLVLYHRLPSVWQADEAEEPDRLGTFGIEGSGPLCRPWPRVLGLSERITRRLSGLPRGRHFYPSPAFCNRTSRPAPLGRRGGHRRGRPATGEHPRPRAVRQPVGAAVALLAFRAHRVAG